MILIDALGLHDYVFTTARSSAAPPHDHGTVAVIDGLIVKITPLRTANVPPPMALHEVEVLSNVIDVAFNVDASLIAVLHQKGISIFEWKSVASSAAPPELTGRVTFDKDEFFTPAYQQISFAGTSEVLVLRKDETGANINRYGFNDDTGRMELVESNANPTSAISTLSSFTKDGVAYPFVQGRKGDLLSLTFGDHSLAHCSFPMYLPWVEISGGEDEIAFGLSSHGHLYANSRLLVKNCTSFLVTSAHLIFTTTTHLLKFVHITQVNGKPFNPYDKNTSLTCKQISKSRQMTQRMMRDVEVLSGELDLSLPCPQLSASFFKCREEISRPFTLEQWWLQVFEN